jgi:hypothetical protein
LVSSISANTQILVTPSEKKDEDNLLFRFSKKFSEQLDLIRIPNKVMSTLLGWAECMPLPSRLLAFIADQREVIKTVASTFALPKFFVKQVKLYETCNQLKNRLSASAVNLGKVIDAVKKTFFASLSAASAGIKLSQLLDKTRIIDLSKISRLLPNVLAKTDCLLSLGLNSMKIVDTFWILRAQIKKENRSPKERNWSFSNKTTKAIVKLGSRGVKVFSNSIAAAALFLGLYINPLVSVAVATLSIADKIIRHSKFFCKGKSKKSEETFAFLPA